MDLPDEACAAAAIRSASATVLANGFSQMTCFPAFNAATAISSWELPGVHTSMMSMSSRGDHQPRQSVSADCHPYFAAAAVDGLIISATDDTHVDVDPEVENAAHGAPGAASAPPP